MSPTDTIKEALRDFVGDAEGVDEEILARHDARVRADLLDELNLRHLAPVQFVNEYRISAVPQSDILGLRNAERNRAR